MTTPKAPSGAPAAEATPPAKRPILPAILFAAVLAAAFFGGRAWLFSSAHAVTDNATLINNVINVSPQVSGTVKRVLVHDNEEVKPGQLIAVLDDAVYQAAAEQAAANLQAAVAQAQGAGVSVTLTAETGGAQEAQATGLVDQAEGGIASAVQDSARAEAAVSTASANAETASSGIGAARAAVVAAQANRSKAAAGLKGAEAQSVAYIANVRAADANVNAAQAAFEKAARDAKRYTALAADGAVGQQVADNALTGEQAARAALDAAKDQASAARAAVDARNAETNAARQQVNAADAAIDQARAALVSAKRQTAGALAGVRQAWAAHGASQDMIRQAQAKRAQALGQLRQARTTPRQVALSRTASAQAVARIAQARAALHAARINLGYTRIYAPVAGRVSKKSVEVGALVSAGTPLLALVPNENVWVVANYKETQLPGVRPGRPAEIEVDAWPGRAFHGHVDSISAATGATFALLPPDNATGNYTKIVQRVPVKIVLDAGQDGLSDLRAGMSVKATISTRP
ncbi:MAG TPA: HlyD family secretion protein [Armatimonadota bacterium]|jgi:membrane fusion protein (multidrug efflux system)